MSNTGWRTTIRSGNADIDLQMLDRHRMTAQQQGLALHSRNLPDGGFEVAATPHGMPSPFDAAAASPYGAPPGYAPTPAPAPVMGGYGPPQPVGGYGPPAGGYGFGPMPAPQAVPQAKVGWARGPGDGGSCQACGRDAQTKLVTFRQNIGALIIRFPKTVNGFLCRHCVEKYFWSMTGITMIGGWWGYISFAYSLFAIPANIYNYITALGLTPPPDDMRSIADKKSRSVMMIVFGVLIGLFAGLWMFASLGLLLSDDADDVSAGIFNMGLSFVFLALPSLLLLAFGIVKRVKAGAKEKELQLTGQAF